MAARPVKIGKGMIEKRTRIVRSLDAHCRNLATLEQVGPWTPTPRTWGPRPKQTREEWDAYWERYAPPRYISPRERPELQYPLPGHEAVTDEQIKEWLAADPFVRSGLSHRTQQALVYIESFKPAPTPEALAARSRAGD